MFLVVSCIWGGAWGILNLTMTAYAYGDGRGAGKRIGVARAASIAGPMLALVAVGPLCVVVGPHQAAKTSSDRIDALASYATWNDVGLAGGAFLGTVGVASLGSAPAYSLMAAAPLLATAWQLVESRKPAA